MEHARHVNSILSLLLMVNHVFKTIVTIGKKYSKMVHAAIVEISPDKPKMD